MDRTVAEILQIKNVDTYYMDITIWITLSKKISVGVPRSRFVEQFPIADSLFETYAQGMTIVVFNFARKVLEDVVRVMNTTTMIPCAQFS